MPVDLKAWARRACSSRLPGRSDGQTLTSLDVHRVVLTQTHASFPPPYTPIPFPVLLRDLSLSRSSVSFTRRRVIIQDTTVELRKSCDYCVRLKRACDGKNPCSLCSLRSKPCTRSARKKSGPAKGTKYAPRRKRSVIAEWADRASVGGKNTGLPPGFPGGGGFAVGVGGGGVVGLGGGAGLGLGGLGVGGPLPHHYAGYPGDGGGGPGMPYHGGRSSSHPAGPGGGGRFGGRDVPSWREDPLTVALSGHPRGRRPPEPGRRSSSSSSAALPFPMGWYGSAAAHDGAEEGGGPGAGMGGGRGGLPPRLDPSLMEYAPTTAEELSRRHQLQPPSHRSAWSVSSLEMEGAGERPGVDPHRRRTWDPHPGEWGGQSNPFLRSPQEGRSVAHGKRVRLVSFVSCF